MTTPELCDLTIDSLLDLLAGASIGVGSDRIRPDRIAVWMAGWHA